MSVLYCLNEVDKNNVVHFLTDCFIDLYIYTNKDLISLFFKMSLVICWYLYKNNDYGTSYDNCVDYCNEVSWIFNNDS